MLFSKSNWWQKWDSRLRTWKQNSSKFCCQRPKYNDFFVIKKTHINTGTVSPSFESSILRHYDVIRSYFGEINTTIQFLRVDLAKKNLQRISIVTIKKRPFLTSVARSVIFRPLKVDFFGHVRSYTKFKH